ncbi:RNA polymerase sigma factor [Aminipila luticellarii]|uniref:Sigma-70 family RNA polymerase sigma factor n=1 Tax=Aminipila luticellarii TaxID=2507160 RepID=A0A410PUB0_9FIRM|nr:RNA polymerase sigma factor [Aminipila luticellarii]QAT42504.1 sigma-70 family RNA polymerase sigma factor [Aminipila luticellarii]
MSTLKNEVYEALIEFIEKNQNNIYRLAYSYVKSQDTALDMVQESIYKAIKAYEKIEDPSSVKPWFYKILVNTCLDELRRSNRMIATAPEELPEEAEDSLSSRADYMVLYKALESLDTETKTVIVLRYFEDMKLIEIAKILEENINSVKSRLYRGLRLLKFQMREGDFSDAE